MILRFANIKLNSKEDSTLRKEIKITSNKQDTDIILQKLETKKAKEIYQEREVNSVYLDTHSFKMFNDSVEGIIPRKKIRIRNYPPKEKYFLEEKITFEKGRKKIVREISITEYSKILQNGLVDNYYGPIKPKIITNYFRRYFFLEKLRITLDKKILYSKFQYNNNLIKEKFNVFEIKANINYEDKKIDSLIGFNRSRFSKYSNAVERIFHV